MAIGNIITALKVVPWADVIAAAPAIVKGARKLFSRTEQPSPAAPPEAGPDERLRLLEGRVQDLVEREQASAKLVAALAEQNALLVEAVGVLRARMRWLLAANVVLLVMLVVGLAVSWGRSGLA